MSHCDTLGDLFDRNIEKWITRFTIVVVFTSRAVTLSRFVRTVTKFIRANTEKESNNIDKNRRELEIFLPSRPTSTSASELAVDVKVRKHATDKHLKTKKTDKED